MSPFLIDSDIKEVVDRLGDQTREFAGKTVLLTGGRGFLGRYFTEIFAHLNEHVLQEPAKVVVLDNLITAGELGAKMPDRLNIHFVRHDVIGPYEWDGQLDYVVHAAGVASPYYYRAYPLEALEVSISGTRHMLDLATRHQAHFMFFSSSEIYGDPDPKHVPTPESYRGNVACNGPRSCYDESKRLGETLCYVFHTKFGTFTNVVRPFNVFGPGMQETDYRALPNFASRIKAGKPLRVYGAGNQTRTFCYVTDALVGFMLIMLRGVPGETYNIGTPEPEVSIVDLVHHLEKTLGRSLKTEIVEHPDSYPADEPQRRCPQIRKAKLQLGYEPRVELDEGLRRFLSWTDANYTGKE